MFYKLLIREGSCVHSKVQKFFPSHSLKRMNLHKLLQVIREGGGDVSFFLSRSLMRSDLHKLLQVIIEGEMFHSKVQKVFSRTP
jgi:hypothetical protein